MIPVGLLKTLVCEFLVSSFLASLLPENRDRRTDRNSYLRVYPLFCFPFSISVFVSVVFPWIPSFAQSTSSSCWSRGRDRSRVTPDCSWSSPGSPPTRTTRSVRSTTPAWTPRTERRRPRMALERISPPLWSGYWREMDLRSQPVPRRISPVPLPTQCPAHHLPAARSACLSPPLTESQSPPWPTSHRRMERQSWGLPRSRSCKWRQLRCVSRQLRLPWGRTPAPSGSFIPLAPLLLRLHRGLPDPCLRVGRRHHLLHLGPPDPPHRPCSSALRLGLLLHLLLHRWSTPWSRRPFLHGSLGVRRLHRGPPLWLWPGSRHAPPPLDPSCLFPGSSLLCRPLGLCLPAPSRVSVLLLSLLLSSRPPLHFGCFYGARTHLPGGGVMSHVWTVLCVFFLFVLFFSLWPIFFLMLPC